MKPIAKENLSLGGKGLSISTKVNTRAEIAKASKVAEETVHRVKFIRDNADEETKSKLRSGNKDFPRRSSVVSTGNYHNS